MLARSQTCEGCFPRECIPGVNGHRGLQTVSEEGAQGRYS